MPEDKTPLIALAVIGALLYFANSQSSKVAAQALKLPMLEGTGPLGNTIFIVIITIVAVLLIATLGSRK